MADRSQRLPIQVTLDAPDVDSITAATLVDALGRVVETVPVETLAPSKHRATFAAPGGPRLDGIWHVRWSNGMDTAFTVGDEPGMTHHEVLIGAISEVSDIAHGQVMQAQGQVITDLSLLGGPGDFVGCFLIPGVGSNAVGRRFRIESYNGSVLTLTEPVEGLLREGDRFTISEIDPYEVEFELREAYVMFAPMARVPVVAEALVPENTTIPVPEGWTDVAEVWANLDDGTEQRLRYHEWDTRPRHRLNVPRHHKIVSFTIRGIRDGAIPQWADSIVDFPGGVVAATVASTLLANRARGRATDPDDSFQRHQFSFQRSAAMLRNWAGRIPNGARRVR